MCRITNPDWHPEDDVPMADWGPDEERQQALDFEAGIATVGYLDNCGINHESYEAACQYYGCDSPADLAAEQEAETTEELANQAIMEGVAKAHGFRRLRVLDHPDWDDIPF